MGMYTEAIITTNLAGMDPIDSAALQYMAVHDADHPPEELPPHPLFSSDRWGWMLQSSSYYFVPRATVLLEWDDIGKYWCFIARFDMKDYGDEIEMLFDWLKRFAPKGEAMGWKRYEEDEIPTIYYGSGEERPENVVPHTA
jgi:hypothetical protein